MIKKISARKCISYAPVMKITVYYVLIISGRVLDRLVGGVKENRLSEKQKVPL